MASSTQTHVVGFALYGAQLRDSGPLAFQPRLSWARMIGPLALVCGFGLLGAFLASRL